MSPSPEPLGNQEALRKLLDKLKAHEGAIGGDGDADKDTSNWLYVTGISVFVHDLQEIGQKTVEDLLVAREGDEQVDAMIPYIAQWIHDTMRALHRTGQFLKRHCMAETRSVVLFYSHHYNMKLTVTF